jgi:hypothetical protein
MLIQVGTSYKLQVALLSFTPRIGGMCSGGLGWSDIGDSWVIGGYANEFFVRVARHYNDSADTPEYHLEPHVAEGVFHDMLNEAGVTLVVTNGSRVQSVAAAGAKLSSLTLTDGSVYGARMFIEGSYEGDLMARSGVKYTWGREPRSQYNESFAGRREPYSDMDWAPASPFDAQGLDCR